MGRRKFFIFHCFIAVLFCGILQGNAAQPRATEILERLAAGFRAMDGYGVKFGVVSGDYEARGSYVVEGDSYYLVLGDAEVFADGAVRREVDNRRREVTVTEVDTASRNILNNPVRAFDFLGSEYTPSLVSEADGRAVVRLTPAAGNDSPAGDVTLTVDTATMRPRSLSYDYDGEQVLVNVLEVAPLAGHVRRFDKNAYGNFLRNGTPGRHVRNRMAARCVFCQVIVTNLRRRLYYICCRKTCIYNIYHTMILKS